MIGLTQLRTRKASIADAAAIAEIYNQGIADRIATFETEPRSAAEIAGWFIPRHLVVVAETGEPDLSPLRPLFPTAHALATPAFGNSRSMLRGITVAAAPAARRSVR
jgi:hypothetical protein